MLRRLRDAVFILLILLYTLFEAVVWEQAVRPIFRALAALRLYHRFLTYIRTDAPRWVVLLLFLFPFVIGEGLGIVSGLLATGLHLVAATVVYACKIPLVVVALAILEHGKSKLLSYRWFAWGYGWVIEWLERLHRAPLYIQTMHRLRTLYRAIADLVRQTRRQIIEAWERWRRR